MNDFQLDVAAALAQATASINNSRTLQETLEAIVHATRTSAPQFAHVSISMRDPNGTLETQAGTDQFVWELDALQYGLGEGPCVHALEAEPVVLVENLRHEQRWPRYTAVALERGVRSQMGVRLFTNGKHVGGLNLYSTRNPEVDRDQAEIARLFATHAAIMLGHAQQEHHLNQALQRRKVIGQAIGILMERYRMDPDRAFQYLVRASSTSNIKVRDLADEIVASSIERYRRD